MALLTLSLFAMDGGEKIRSGFWLLALAGTLGPA